MRVDYFGLGFDSSRINQWTYVALIGAIIAFSARRIALAMFKSQDDAHALSVKLFGFLVFIIGFIIMIRG